MSYFYKLYTKEIWLLYPKVIGIYQAWKISWRRIHYTSIKNYTRPNWRFGFDKHTGKGPDEFIAMYYQPCIAALFGINFDYLPDVESK